MIKMDECHYFIAPDMAINGSFIGWVTRVHNFHSILNSIRINYDSLEGHAALLPIELRRISHQFLIMHHCFIF